MVKIAIVRLRGRTGLQRGVADTLALLNLHRINNCVVLESSPETVGMIRKAKDYITWGAIDDSTLKLLIEKRGRDGKKTFRLDPPKGGLGSRGIKAAFSKSGALGDRKEKINDLLKNMMRA